MDQVRQQKAIMDAPWMECECGGITFTQLIMVKRISKLLSGAAQDSILEVPMMKCDSCGKIPEFMHKPWGDIPEEYKAKPSITLEP